MVRVDYLKGGAKRHVKMIFDTPDGNPDDINEFSQIAERCCDAAGIEFVQAIRLDEVEIQL